MPDLKDLEVGIMFWASDADPLETVRDAKSLGVSSGQLGIRGNMLLQGAAEVWTEALRAEDFTVATVFCAFEGESYKDIPTVQRTVGFIPSDTREAREQRTKEVSHFAADIGVNSIACHIGFVPDNPEHPDFVAVRDVVRRICDHAALHGQSFALETGQESADVLLNFVHAVERPNLGINFDPANLILYGAGDPIEALEVLHEHVLSVHCKDGVWPPKMPAGALGTETPLGEGAVGMDKFVAKLKQFGYKGTLNIEHEIEDQEQRRVDICNAVELLNRLRATS